MKAYDRTTYDGHTVNYRTKAMLWQMADYLGYDLTVSQGSYSTSVGASAGTHDGGGAVDLAPADWENKVKVGRMVGFSAWHRTAIPGLWNEHIHMIAIGDKEMSDAARKQVQDYFAHLDGLASHQHDPEWRPNQIVRFHYPLKVCDLGAVRQHIDNGAKEPRGSVKLIQHALNLKSGTHLAVDGLYGPLTRSAYRRYEVQNDGDGDGLPGALTKKLGLALFKVKAGS